MNKIKVAVAGVGNCTSSLVQGVEFIKRNKKSILSNFGILHPVIGKYRIEDIEFVAAFDIDSNKIGKDFSDAIFSQPNCSSKLLDVPQLGVLVDKGPILDGVNNMLERKITVDRKSPICNVKDVLIQKDAQILINFLPTGSKEGSIYYANQALGANCGFINAIPELIASNPKWGQRFSSCKLPLAGDDIKSQIGGTIIHRTLIDLFLSRGVEIDETSQINYGGNMDYLNLSDKKRFETKLISKQKSIESLLPYQTKVNMPIPNYVEELGDNRICKIQINGRYFGNTPVVVDVDIKIEDSPNSAGVMIDIIRIMKLAIDRGEFGVLTEICPFYFKHPPVTCDDTSAYQKVKNYIQLNG